MFSGIISDKAEHTTIYTVGSNNNDRVTFAAVAEQQATYHRLPSKSFNVTVGAYSILFALKFATSCDKSTFIICSDYLLCHLATENVKSNNSFIF